MISFLKNCLLLKNVIRYIYDIQEREYEIHE